MCNVVFNYKDKYIKADFNEQQGHFTVETNMTSLDLFPLDHNLKNNLVSSDLWCINDIHKLLDILASKLCVSLRTDTPILRGDVYFNSSNNNDINVEFDEHIGIKDLCIYTGDTDDSFKIDKYYSNKSQHKTESITIFAGSGNDTISSDVDNGLPYQKKHHRYRFNYFGQSGKDRISIKTYGINYLSGGLDNDHYQLIITASTPHFHNKLEEISKKSTEAFTSPGDYLKNTFAELKQFISGQTPYNTSKPAISFINDYGNEQNQINVKIMTEKPNDLNDRLPVIYIASSDQLHPATARKLSSDPFLVIKTTSNFILIHPQVTDNISFWYNDNYPGQTNLFMAYSPDVKQQKNSDKLYSFHQMPEGFNFRKLRAQLNGIIYTPITSLDKYNGNDFYLGDLMSNE